MTRIKAAPHQYAKTGCRSAGGRKPRAMSTPGHPPRLATTKKGKQ